MRVDLVSAPVRYRTLPLLGLFVVMLIPVALLVALLMWSDGEADEHEAAVDGESSIPEAPPVVAPVQPALDTSLLAYRRTPALVGSVRDANQLAAAMEQLYVFVGEGSCVAVAVDGRTVSTRNPTTPVIPASTHKLLVATVALDVLGPDHRFTTSVASPPVVDGVIEGDVFLVGGGDPVLTSDDYPIDQDRQPAFNTTSLDALADAFVATGVTTIRGAIVGDGSRFDDERTIESWGPGVALVDAGPIDALVVNDSRRLGRTGRQSDPDTTAAREFARLLGARGVTISNGWDSGTTPPEVGVVASIQSAPLSDILAEMLTTSDNDTAEILLKELGVADAGLGTLAAGLTVIDRTLRGWGVPMDDVRLVDGSGLSSENRVTCAALLAVLDRAAGTPVAAGLPIAGRTGTLTDEFAGTAVEGRLIAKTGTLGNPPADQDPPEVKGLAGYLPVESGETLSFAMIITGPGIVTEDGYTGYWTALAERLAAFPADPDRTPLGPR
ncbi:MAG: D-alanyl-D-alanine carboxypeptidase/D-alanyl-D-alanine-endopeptidase [Ilumatobacteraceae bacterium]